MNTRLEPGGRLPFRVDPVPGESPRGYLCRVAQAYAYGGPLSLAHIAGLPVSGLESDQGAEQIAHVLRLEAEEWRGMSYRHIKGRKRFQQRLFCGERIRAGDPNYKRPPVCPSRLHQRPARVA